MTRDKFFLSFLQSRGEREGNMPNARSLTAVSHSLCRMIIPFSIEVKTMNIDRLYGEIEGLSLSIRGKKECFKIKNYLNWIGRKQSEESSERRIDDGESMNLGLFLDYTSKISGSDRWITGNQNEWERKENNQSFGFIEIYPYQCMCSTWFYLVVIRCLFNFRFFFSLFASLKRRINTEGLRDRFSFTIQFRQMDYQYFKLLVICFCFSMTASLRCYTGTDKQCMISSNTHDCGNGARCQCIKYKFQCTSDDTACTNQEKTNKAMKWAYSIVSQSTCEMMKRVPNIYMNAECCSKDKCNRPTSGKCSWSQERRRRIRQLTNMIELDWDPYIN